MGRQNGLTQIWFLIGATLSGVGLIPTGGSAQTASPGNDAWAKADPEPYWWFHGTVEVGGRGFLNNPDRNGYVYLNQNSLAKYYQYTDIAPGPFSNIWLSTGSRDGLHQVDIGGMNIGYDDQFYYFEYSKAGEYYFNFSWDQTPHLYSTSALTPYLGVGTNVLTLPPGAIGTNAKTIRAFDNRIDIGIRRDTAAFAYRWTPTDAVDIKADYSHMSRSGTQVDGITGINGSAFSGPIQVPKPVSDTTQNYGVSGEYVGTSPLGKRYSFKLGYIGSQYTDGYSAYTVVGPAAGVIGRMSTWPSNQANGFSGIFAADLPWQSRYVGTVEYTMMRQDAAFIPMSYNAPYALPKSSLDGEINTLVSNNVLTTMITPEIRAKLSYRYYDFQNNTPEIYFANWIRYDSAAASANHFINSLSMAYTKQNVSEELTWRPTSAWRLGAAYGYERYDWTRADADATNEHTGKVFVDWTPTNWFRVRSSGSYGDRRYENYDYHAFVGDFQFPTAGASSWRYQDTYRQLTLSNRQTWKANVGVNVVVVRGLTVTPVFKYLAFEYSVDPKNQQGLHHNRSWSGGVDVTYVIVPGTSVMVGYLRENRNQAIYGLNCTGNSGGTFSGCVAPQTLTTDDVKVDTVTAVLRYAVIPDKLDTEVRYTESFGVDSMKLFPFGSSGTPVSGQFPDVRTRYQRLDASATYTFDKQQIAMLGWKGEVKAKIRFVWERNTADNWANDTVAPWTSWAGNGTIWMGYDNPNYDVQMLLGSLAFTW